VLITFENSEILDGQESGLVLEGMYIFYIIIVVANIKVLISSFEYTFWMLFWIFGSIILYYIAYALYSLWIMSSPVYGLMDHTIGMF
jgi:hypothetical protein